MTVLFTWELWWTAGPQTVGVSDSTLNMFMKYGQVSRLLYCGSLNHSIAILKMWASTSEELSVKLCGFLVTIVWLLLKMENNFQFFHSVWNCLKKKLIPVLIIFLDIQSSRFACEARPPAKVKDLCMLWNSFLHTPIVYE